MSLSHVSPAGGAVTPHTVYQALYIHNKQEQFCLLYFRHEKVEQV